MRKVTKISNNIPNDFWILLEIIFPQCQFVSQSASRIHESISLFIKTAFYPSLNENKKERSPWMSTMGTVSWILVVNPYQATR